MAGFQLRNLIKIRRAGDLSCPDCSVIMSPYRCGDVIIDKCESCDGIWFDHQEIGAFKKSLDQMDLSDLVGVFHPSESTDSHTIPICPRCQIPLYEGEYNYNSKVKVHRCERCRGVWLPLVQTLRLIDLARLSQAIAPHATGLAHEFEKADTEIRIYQNLERTGQQLMTRVHHHSSAVFALFGILVPLYDQNPRKSTPVVTIALILTNMLILQWMAWGDVPIRELYETFALQPSEIVRINSLYTLFASCFMHAGLIHLLVNMYCLWLFGDNMEDILGARKYIALYLLSGLVGNIIHVLANQDSVIPTLGASGAIAGLFGAYLYTFPHVNLKIYFGVPALSFISNYRYILDIPIWMFLGVWFALQFFWSFIHYEAGIGGVAWWAHIGGFAAGFIMMMIAEKLKWVQIKRPYLPLSS